MWNNNDNNNTNLTNQTRFIKSGQFKKVIAADFSETMLQQTQQYIRDDFTIPPTSYCLVRCDAARLPFESGSVDAIHAGAAIHCWPQPQVAVCVCVEGCVEGMCIEGVCGGWVWSGAVLHMS